MNLFRGRIPRQAAIEGIKPKNVFFQMPRLKTDPHDTSTGLMQLTSVMRGVIGMFRVQPVAVSLIFHQGLREKKQTVNFHWFICFFPYASFYTLVKWQRITVLVFERLGPSNKPNPLFDPKVSGVSRICLRITCCYS